MKPSGKGPALAVATAAAFVGAVLLLAAVTAPHGRAGARTEATDPGEEAAEASAEAPNILFLFADDADRALHREMPKIRRVLEDRGTTFPNAFAPFSTCCPSRATVLRGQYPHNSGVLSNQGRNGGLRAFRTHGGEEDNLATRLDGAGYRTGLFGKYLNGYGKPKNSRAKSPGWDVWHAGHGGVRRMETIRSTAAGPVVDRHDFRKRHASDVYGGRAARFIRRSGSAGSPWFAFVSFRSPHLPEISEERYAKKYRNASYPGGPAFDEADVSDKPRWVRELDRVSGAERKKYDRLHRGRLRMMRGVDDQVGRLVRVLRETDQLENTYIVFWNDNGFHMGEHRIPKGKRTAYEEDVRYPLIVRGPGVPAGERDPRLLSGVDLLPTFLDWAGASEALPDYADGRSFAPLLGETPGGEKTPWRDAVLLEGYDDGFDPEKKPYVPPDFRAVRTADNRSYVEYETGEREFYLMDSDPRQMESRHADPARARQVEGLSARLSDLRGCRGGSCRAADGGPATQAPGMRLLRS